MYLFLLNFLCLLAAVSFFCLPIISAFCVSRAVRTFNNARMVPAWLFMMFFGALLYGIYLLNGFSFDNLPYLSALFSG